MKSLCSNSSAPQELSHPQPSSLPSRGELLVSARYQESRLGGDFYDFVEVSDQRLLVVLLDIAGKKDDAFQIAAVAQQVFRNCGRKLLSGDDLNVADAITELLLEMNRSVLAAAQGVRCTPAFLGCYDSEFGLLHYCNAGHVPAFVRDYEGISTLESNGLPLGLFSHATHDAQLSALRPGAALVLVSKGLIEARNGRQEFGIERVKSVLAKSSFESAQEICNDLLDSVQKFTQQPTHFGPQLHVPGFRNSYEPNDSTVVALIRAQRALAMAS